MTPEVGISAFSLFNWKFCVGKRGFASVSVNVRFILSWNKVVGVKNVLSQNRRRNKTGLCPGVPVHKGSNDHCSFFVKELSVSCCVLFVLYRLF